MFKKAVQIAVTFALLVGAFLGYTYGFAFVETQLATSRLDDDSTPFPVVESNSTLHANQLARECFPAGHWATSDELKMIYFDPGRSCYMYAETYERLNEGKTIKVKPFAMISESKDGKARKTVTSDMAVIDLSQPFGFVKVGSEPSRVTHALLSGNVHIRDDKATIADPDDDLRVSFDPEAVVEYDEKTLKITTVSQVIIQDRDLTMTGLGMMIQLRRKPPSLSDSGTGGGGTAGFNAETATLWKDVHIVANNVTPNGILPGSSKPDAKGKTPLDLRCDAEMVVYLPHPRPKVDVGPQYNDREPDPTFAKFHVNVRVRRGVAAIDQLNSDTLDLTLMPDRKPVLTEAQYLAQENQDPDEEKPAAPGSGPLTELKLRKALAQGHAVWVQSESQGLKARCIELTYEKHLEDGQPDKTYLNGGPSGVLDVEKVDLVTKGENIGSVESVRRLKALDATIFDYGPGGRSKVIARGPGKMEERPARNASIERTVWFEDLMENLTWRDDPPASFVPATSADEKPMGTLWRKITLTGPSKLVDIKGNATLDAVDRIIATFKSEPRPKPFKGDGPSQIQFLQAFKDVHMTSSSKVLSARDQLDAKFEPMPVVVVPAPVFVAGPVVAQAAPPPPPPEEKPDKGPEPSEPAVDGRAHYVFATILQGEGTNKSEVKDAKLRGGVMVHQDPAPGEAYGKDASGEALDLFNQGKGLMRFVVSAEEPHAANARAKLASNKERPTLPATLARVDFDGKTIEGPIISLDQMADYAHVQGPGNFVQMADRGLLSEAGLAPNGTSASAAKKPGAAGAKDKMVITWNDEMKFFGLSKDLLDRPAAKIEFRGTSEEVRMPNGQVEFRRGVQAKQQDSATFSDAMTVYMDRPINFKRDVTKPPPVAGQAAEPDAQIAMINWRGDTYAEDGKLKFAGVDITSRKRYPGTDFVRELQRIRHVNVTYDKRTGDFEAPGPGIVYLYQAEEPKKKAEPVARQVSGVSKPAEPIYIPKKQPAYKLTKVKFNEGMRGKFSVAKDQEPKQASESEFVGNVQAVNAVVASPLHDVDFDNFDRYNDAMSISSDVLRVFSFPAPGDSKAPARQQLNGQGNALARTIDRTITGDRITYDSGSDLMFVYGDEGKEIAILEQKSAGQVANTLRGKSGYYNKTTRQGQVDDPHDITMYDLKSGIRPKPFYPDLGGTPKPFDPLKAQRMPLMRPSRNSTERNPFTGR